MLAVLLAGAAYLFFGSYGRYLYLHARLHQSERDLRILARERQEIEKKSRLLARAKAFVDKAQSLGLEKSRWDTYEVEIQEAVTFPEAREILAQTVPTGAYYFIPRYLHVTKDLSEMKEHPGKGASPQTAEPPGAKKGDVFLDLKGSFLVKAR